MRIGLKSDVLRAPSTSWTLLFDTYPDLLNRLRAIGVDGVEASISVRGEADHDAKALEALMSWYEPWGEKGFGLVIHPYTSGAANPAAFQPGEDETPLEALSWVTACARRLVQRYGRPIKLVYHAAEAKSTGEGDDPRERRSLYLERSKAFFGRAWERLDTQAAGVELLTETQLPTREGDPRVRIGDRPDEIEAIVAGRPASVCLDTGHYLISVRQLGSSPEPGFLAYVGHMHLHDVEGERDHRPLSGASREVARYVALAAERGSLSSVTAEYKLEKALSDPQRPEPAELLDHVQMIVGLIRQWVAGNAAAASPVADGRG